MVDLSTLNGQQQDSVSDSLGPSDKTVVLAGAGSGKTRTVTFRIAHLIEQCNVKPENIMCVTFTNKAANEMKERIESLGVSTKGMWIGTFHSVCVRILRRFGKGIGISNFTIMDTKDKKKFIKSIIEDSGMVYEDATVSNYESKISDCKNHFINPDASLSRSSSSAETAFSLIYREYQSRAWSKKMFDFDDLIIYTYLLLFKNPQVKQWFHTNITHLIVDEYQDTNITQFKLIQEITGNNNLFCVGDDYQSIYGFRNAKPEYIINFEKYFPNSKVKKFEINYRSTKKIVQAGNSIIQRNVNRTDKNMYTQNSEGSQIVVNHLKTSIEEASFVAKYIKTLAVLGTEYKNVAVLYRLNMQSRIFEQIFAAESIPFKVVGALSFFDRKEIKDMTSILKFYSNHNDVISFSRVLSLYKGVGAKAISAIITYADTSGVSLREALSLYKVNSKAITTCLNSLIYLFDEMDTKKMQPYQAIDFSLKVTGYLAKLQAEDTEEAQDRIDNLEELKVAAHTFTLNNPNCTIQNFVDDLSLTTTVQATGDEPNAVKLMTIHSSKGLEFDTVFCVGWEEGLLPHKNSLSSVDQIEEECRLAYVSVTRAEKNLIITHSKTRMLGNKTTDCRPSRFLSYIPDYIVSKVE